MTRCSDNLRRVVMTVYVLAVFVTAEAILCTEENADVPNHGHILRVVPNEFIIYECDSGYEFNDTEVGIQWCHRANHAWTGDRGTCELSSAFVPTPTSTPTTRTQSRPMMIRRRRPGGATIQRSKCESRPCKNGGSCDDSEDPYGWGFYCICKRDFGGRLCQISDPCRTAPCPSTATKCFRSQTRDSGRFCYDDAWNLVES